MITLLIFILFVLASVFFVLRYFKTGFIIFSAALAFFFISASGILQAFLVKSMESYPMLTQPQWGKKNAIIVLGGGTVILPMTDIVKPSSLTYTRVYEAARLYFLCQKENVKCSMIVSGGDAAENGQSEAAAYRDEFLALGVKASDIIVEDRSMNTYRNAEFTSLILKSQPFDRVLLVTAGIHMKRALLYFSHFGIYPIPAVSDSLLAKISFVPMGYNLAIADLAVHEIIGIARFHIYNYLGLN